MARIVHALLASDDGSGGALRAALLIGVTRDHAEHVITDSTKIL
jgi:hypothetical protein